MPSDCRGSEEDSDDLRKFNPQIRLDVLSADVLSYCQVFEETMIRKERYNFFSDFPQTKTCIFILHGCIKQFMQEIE